MHVAATARIPGVEDELERAALALANEWLRIYRAPIMSLPDHRRAQYAELVAMAGTPQTISILRPKVRTESSVDTEGNPVATRPRHLMSDADGNFPIGSLGSWEVEVLDRELPYAIAWYRNPPRSDDALSIAYKDGKDAWRRLFPDLIFFNEIAGTIRPSIVDPHWHDLPDALHKLRGLARYATEHADDFHRIEAVSKIDDVLRVLDLTQQTVREAIDNATTAAELYRGPLATDY